MELCLYAGAAIVRLGVTALTLAWTHSVEKTQWEEDWRLTPYGLVIAESRIEGTGAGMEPPPHARFDGRWYRWHPKAEPVPQATFRRSGMAGDWTVCREKRCDPMGTLVPADADPVILRACP